jgi:choline transport protein
MVYAQLVGFALGVFFLIIYVPCVIDLEGAIGEKTGYPFLFVFKNAFSPAFVHTTTVTVALLILAGTLPYNLSSSRQMLAVCSSTQIDVSR